MRGCPRSDIPTVREVLDGQRSHGAALKEQESVPTIPEDISQGEQARESSGTNTSFFLQSIYAKQVPPSPNTRNNNQW